MHDFNRSNKKDQTGGRNIGAIKKKGGVNAHMTAVRSSMLQQYDSTVNGEDISHITRVETEFEAPP